MKNKIIFITKEVEKKIKLEEFDLQESNTISPQKLQKIKNNQTEIHIYDLGFNRKNKIIPIVNHINKTGKNPLRTKKTTEIQFYDITKIYQKQKGGKVAECFGNKIPTKQQNKYIQTKFLCNYAILAHCLGFKKIFGYVID